MENFKLKDMKEEDHKQTFSINFVHLVHSFWNPCSKEESEPEHAKRMSITEPTKFEPNDKKQRKDDLLDRRSIRAHPISCSKSENNREYKALNTFFTVDRRRER